jgi:hypothetical protein
MHVWMKPKLHIHKECGLRLHPLLHTSHKMDCLTAPLDEVAPQDIMFSEKASDSPGLCPVKGQKSSLGPKLILEPVFGCYQDLAVVPDTGYPNNI